ncbi:hypothetical protein BKA67DRAFT_532948 [Truncatella angustata]|uniref:Uncharacterized protein n=1 Tax=Truncatella angustata TaxID=152316 RepID=A0A9P8UTG2_9PEZI|nr:uncharacterized protein BKA67DRAFT_532948 [Truncatella angustata]KAH6657757.1 hypothetical protein BKA67DRAFT_532948 [Truncatella angustata]
MPRIPTTVTNFHSKEAQTKTVNKLRVLISGFKKQPAHGKVETEEVPVKNWLPEDSHATPHEGRQRDSMSHTPNSVVRHAMQQQYRAGAKSGSGNNNQAPDSLTGIPHIPYVRIPRRQTFALCLGYTASRLGLSTAARRAQKLFIEQRWAFCPGLPGGFKGSEVPRGFCFQTIRHCLYRYCNPPSHLVWKPNPPKTQKARQPIFGPSLVQYTSCDNGIVSTTVQRNQ